jgi:hypothetical protein
VMPFNASVVFFFTSSTFAKLFPLRTFFIRGIKRSRAERDRVTMAGGEAVSCCFWLKIVSHSRLCARARCHGEATTPTLPQLGAFRLTASRKRCRTCR